MPNLLITVNNSDHLDTLLKLVRYTGYLSKRSPLSIELPDQDSAEVIFQLQSTNIPFLVREIGRSGELRAIAAPPPQPVIEPESDDRRQSRRKKLFTAFGESKAMHEWIEDPRCVVSQNALWRWLNEGWSPEKALTTPTKAVKNPKTAIAFGETRTIAQWAKDPRRKVPEKCVEARIRQGWNVERALFTPIERSSPRALNTPPCPKCGCDRAVCRETIKPQNTSNRTRSGKPGVARVVRKLECVRCLNKFKSIKTA